MEALVISKSKLQVLALIDAKETIKYYNPKHKNCKPGSENHIRITQFYSIYEESSFLSWKIELKEALRSGKDILIRNTGIAEEINKRYLAIREMTCPDY